MKVFPASSLGPEYIQSVRGPLPDIPMIAVGGVSIQNARGFFDAGVVGLGLGGSLIDRNAIESGDLHTITGAARSFVDLYQRWTREERVN